MASGDRLSNLPDDLLRRVLRFAPAKEAASTNTLSGRWRSLWRSSGAVNLEVRSRGDDYCGNYMSDALSFSIVSAANAALYGAVDPVTRLSFRLENISWVHGHDPDVVSFLLSHPAARLVEELQIDIGDRTCRMNYPVEDFPFAAGVCALSLGSLPSDTLRVLDLTNCSALTRPSTLAFPCLASLRLRLCVLRLDDLQGVIDSAPALATVHLEYVNLYGDDLNAGSYYDGGAHSFHLRCPAATALVLAECIWPKKLSLADLKIDAPRLRRFRYKGFFRPITLSPQAPDLARVDLCFNGKNYYGPFAYDDRKQEYTSEILWRSLRNFTNSKELKLRVNQLEDIAVVGGEATMFGNLELLDLEGEHRPKGKTAAMAIANLLCCCPVVRDLGIKLSAAGENDPRMIDRLQANFKHDLDESLDDFRCRRSRPRVTIQGGIGDANHDVDDLPALSRRSFSCLQSSLRCVRLQFRSEKSNCFGAKLIKFFAENAVHLEEIRIDDGNRKMREHMNCNVERWIANSSQARGVKSAAMKSIRVLPLER